MLVTWPLYVVREEVWLLGGRGKEEGLCLDTVTADLRAIMKKKRRESRVISACLLWGKKKIQGKYPACS